MSKVLVNETSLNGIASAIREKNGETTKYKPSEMAAAISALVIGGGGSGEGDGDVPNPIVFDNVCSYLFYKNRWKWILDKYGDRIQTNNVSEANYMFSETNLPNGVPFEINLANGSPCKSMFERCELTLPDDFFLKEGMNGKIGDINGMFNYAKIKKIPSFKQSQKNGYYDAKSWLINSEVEEIGDLQLHIQAFTELFRGAGRLRHIPNIVLTSPTVHTYKYASASNIFSGCYSLRTIPEAFLKEMYNTAATGSSYAVLKGLFNSLYSLDEIVGISPQTPVQTSNIFTDTFYKCFRVKRIVFDTINGTPYNVSWANQTINLYNGVGWLTDTDSTITGWYNGITADKKVDSSTTYAALKNDPDWFTNKPEYSRFNHDSAVEFINSLPNTKTFLDTNGGTNTVKFRQDAGSSTDGGSIGGNLTEEEIAIAVNKGWSISYAV